MPIGRTNAKSQGLALALTFLEGNNVGGALSGSVARYRLVAAFSRYSGAVYDVHLLLTLIALINSSSSKEGGGCRYPIDTSFV